MKTICKAVLILLITVNASSSFAQDSTKSEGKIKEYVLTLSNLSPLNMGIRYKKQLREKTFFKVGLINLNASSTSRDPNLSTSFPTLSYNLSAGFELGLEFRKGLNNNFTFFHGPNISVNTSERFMKVKNPAVLDNKLRTTYQSHTFGIPYTLGILLHLKGHFFMSAEINPGLFFTYTKFENGDEMRSPSIGFGNSYGLLSLVYRR